MSDGVRSGRRLIWIALIIVVLLAFIAYGVEFYLKRTPPSLETITYLTHGSPTSQWLVLSFSSLPAGVDANNTGQIPEYQTSQALNGTRIGVYCEQTVTKESTSVPGGNSTIGACAQFVTYQQTGWYWDKENDLLFVHYLGGSNVEISIALEAGAKSHG